MTPPNNNGYYKNGDGFLHAPSSNGNGHHQQNDNDPDEIDLKHLFYLLWGHKWIIGGVTLLCAIIAGVVAYQQTPIYQSDGSIMIKESQSQLGSGDTDLGSLISSSYGIGMGNTVADELQVLQSRSLSQEVADTLVKMRLMDNGRQFPVLFKSFPEDSSLARADSIAYRLRQNISFSQADRESKLINISYKSPSPMEAAKIINLTIDMYSQLSTRQNRKSANAAVAFLENERAQIEDRLNEAELQLQEFMDQNELVQVDEQVSSMINRLATLEQRRQEARTMLVAANSAVEQYEQQLNGVKPGLAEQYADAIGPNMSRLQYQVAELKTERMQMLSKNPQLRNSDTPSSQLEELDRQITQYEEEIHRLTEKLLGQSDQYLGFLGSDGGNIAQNITELNQKLIELKVEQEQYGAQDEVLSEEIAELNQVFDELPENMTGLARLKRNVTVNEELYLTVSKQYAEMSLWQQTQFGQGQLVDEGFIPEVPVEPNKKLFVLVGLVLGGILSVGYVFVKEAFNNTIDGVQKLKEFDIPMLSVIPDLQKYGGKKDHKEKVKVGDREVSANLVSLIDSTSPVAESLRRLEANIVHSDPDEKIKSLVVTSTTMGEGKTTVLSNLGVIMAEADQKVVVVDTDLRRPNLHNMFGMGRTAGLVDVLFENSSLGEAIKPTILPNLDVLTAGSKPPNPSAVLKSASFTKLIHELEQQYDWVLLDTPPYGIITDASAFMEQAGGVVLVSRFGKSQTGELQHTLSALEQVGANILGTVLNAFDTAQSSDYYYASNYYQDYFEDYEEYGRSSL